MMTKLQDKANDAFYAWETANNKQDLSDDARMIWTAGWIEASKKYVSPVEEFFASHEWASNNEGDTK